MNAGEFHNAGRTIIAALRQVRRSVLADLLAGTALRLFAAATGAVLLLLSLERLYYLPGIWRIGILTAVGLGLAGIVAQSVRRAWIRCGRLSDIARLGDNSLPELKNRGSTDEDARKRHAG